MTKIDKCSCDSKFQDKRYGKGMRVFNKTDKENEYRCAVCKNVKIINK
jgi:hypothetical protein